MKLVSDVHTGVGTPHRIQRQGGDTAQKDRTDEKSRGGHSTLREEVKYKCCWVGGWFIRVIMPLCGSILQVGTCQILSLA